MGELIIEGYIGMIFFIFFFYKESRALENFECYRVILLKIKVILKSSDEVGYKLMKGWKKISPVNGLKL